MFVSANQNLNQGHHQQLMTHIQSMIQQKEEHVNR